ncbi:MAG: asparagine synthase (glutamine-hydrolyzing) [Deltaproteobacteria bacterium]
MCGICGVAHADAEFPGDRTLLKRMTEIIRHRGPDSQGEYVGPGIGLGVARLAINDLESGDQPIGNEDGSIVIVCNGEIYNFHELRRELESRGHRFRSRSDVEVIVHLYEDHGEECVQSLRGMFAFALWDARRGQLMLARDRVGMKPLNYAIERDGMYFGSEIKSILVAGRIERQLDVQALSDMFTVGFVLTPRTLFTRIQRLPAGYYLIYREGTASIRRYWDPTFPAVSEDGPRMSADDWARALREKLEESVRIHLRSDVPVGAWLSSGLDSSAIVALMARLTHSPVQTFTLSFANPNFDEVDRWPTLDRFQRATITNRVVRFDIKQFEVFPHYLWHIEIPVTGGHLPRLLLSRITSERFKTVLTGEGADEIFGGYSWFRGQRLFEPVKRIPRLLVRPIARMTRLSRRWQWVSNFILPPWEMNLERYVRMMGPHHADELGDLVSDHLRSELPNDEQPNADHIETDQLKGKHPFLRMQYLEMKTRLVDYINHGVDRTSMANSVEVRLPFLDHELIEFCARIPPSLKMRGLNEKFILRQAMAGILPPEVARRRKRPLSAPYGQLLRGDLPEFAKEALSETDLRSKGYFNPRSVQSMMERHRSGRSNYTHELMTVVAVQIWHDLFMRDCRPASGSTSHGSGSAR